MYTHQASQQKSPRQFVLPSLLYQVLLSPSLAAFAPEFDRTGTVLTVAAKQGNIDCNNQCYLSVLLMWHSQGQLCLSTAYMLLGLGVQQMLQGLLLVAPLAEDL